MVLGDPKSSIVYRMIEDRRDLKRESRVERIGGLSGDRMAGFEIRASRVREI